jgi:hypothetical protein
MAVALIDEFVLLIHPSCWGPDGGSFRMVALPLR